MVRHSSSDSKEPPLRKELMQCQYCYKSRGSGHAALSKCSACKVALYCSRECQKAAWPSHKEKCKLNQRQLTMPPDQVDAIRDLRHFTTKHRPTLSDTGIRALDLCLDPTRALRDVVVVFVKPRPDSTRVETSFIVTDAEVVPVEFFGPERAEEMRGQLKYVNEENKRMGGPGGILVVLIDTESHVMNAVGMGFGEEVKDMKPGLPWKEKLMEKLNNGIML